MTDYTQDFIVNIGTMSPATAGATSNWIVRIYSDETDITKVIDEITATGRDYSNTPTYPWDFWAEWPTVS